MKTLKKISFVFALLTIISNSYGQKPDNLVLTPPMGWNSWNTFATAINEQLIKETADAMVASGLLAAGYEYLILDDGWSAMQRNEEGKLYGDPEKFPSGMKALGDYIHSKGLKFGIYNCAGDKTCGGFPGSRGHEYMDARTYAEWGVDYLKYDWCNTKKLNAEGAYQTMANALNATGRPVVFSLCEWGHNEPWKWGKDIGHLWRVTGDIDMQWDGVIKHKTHETFGVWAIINMHEGIREYSGPGHWNDFDMLEVGNGLTDAEDRSHFAMWAILASPLIMGNDLRSMDQKALEILTNKEIIAINQDSLGIQGFRLTNENNIEIWVKPLSKDAWAISFVNMNEEPYSFDFNWSKEKISDDINKRNIDFQNQTYEITDVFKNKRIGDTKESLEVTLGVHDVLMIKLIKKE